MAGTFGEPEFQLAVVGKDHVDEIGQLFLGRVQRFPLLPPRSWHRGRCGPEGFPPPCRRRLCIRKLFRLSDVVEKGAGDEEVLLQKRVGLLRLQAEIQDGERVVEKASHVGMVDGDCGRIAREGIAPLVENRLCQKSEVCVFDRSDPLVEGLEHLLDLDRRDGDEAGHIDIALMDGESSLIFNWGWPL